MCGFSKDKKALQKTKEKVLGLIQPCVDIFGGTLDSDVFPVRDEVEIVTGAPSYGKLRCTVSLPNTNLEAFLYFGNILHSFANMIQTMDHLNASFSFEKKKSV